MKLNKILLISGLIIVIALALKSMKQLISLSLTLLSLKVVWVALIILFVLTLLKKRMRRLSRN